MLDRNQYLLELVKRNVKAYLANPKTKAVMVTGSVAEGECDEYSDCDVCLYYDELPTDAELQFARQQNQGAELIEILGDRREGAFGESLLMNGIEFQFAHATIAQWEKEISSIVEAFDVPTPLMKTMAGTLVGIPLYGETLIEEWKAKIANYPDGLAQRMVEHYLKFVPVWGMQEKLARRDTTLWYHQILVESAQNLLGVLSGLNRLYYSTFQFKRMSRFIEQMEIAPENLSERLESLFHHEAPVAVDQLEVLVRETIKLVEIHMPQVDTSSAKRKIGWRQQPWKLSESNR
jgi:predicted nucleotidyltransferase